MSACRSCGAQVEWVVSATSGKRLPLDPEPVPGGNVVVTDGAARVVAPDPEVTRRVSHYATCPDADRWRRR